MQYALTTFDNEGNEIVSRTYKPTDNREDYADQIESILEDSQTYLEEQAVDYKEEPLTE